MPRRTKIVATLGPATDDEEVLKDLIDAGVDVVRMNLSHGVADDHLRRARLVREYAASRGHEVGVLADLQGPKIRVGHFRDGAVELRDGAHFILDADCPTDAGTAQRVGFTYPELPRDVRPGDHLLLDDGLLELYVEQVEGGEIHCRVEIGGALSDGKGINRRGGGLSASALTDKDRDDIRVAAQIEADFLGVSFARSADDVNEARALLRAAGGQGDVCAKIERAEALEVIEEIIAASDVIMIARGDLGVEYGDVGIPALQKRLIPLCRQMNKVVITATQMLQSMIDSPIPTRAEVSDVANAVLDGTDAVMLSAETASGHHPVRAVEAMHRICREAEKHRLTRVSGHRLDLRFGRIDEAIAMATMYTANHLDVKAIAALTESGSTPLWMSRMSSGIPIYAASRQRTTRRKVTLYRGVYPLSFDSTRFTTTQANRELVADLLEIGAVARDDLVVITKGDMIGVHGGTNVMKVVKVGHLPEADAAG